MRNLVRWLLASCCLTAVAAVSAQAPEPKPEENEVTRLIDEHQQHFKAWRDTGTESGEPDPAKDPTREYMPKVKALVEKYAGQPPAITALRWIVNWAETLEKPDGEAQAKWALERLARDHAADPNLKDALRNTMYVAEFVGVQPLIGLYDRVIAKNPDKETVARAMYEKGAVIFRYGASENETSAQAKARTQQALDLFRQIIKNYPGMAIVERAESFIFEIEHLQIGMKAPDFAGTDAEEKDIKLADLRGRVVVLHFWGFW